MVYIGEIALKKYWIPTAVAPVSECRLRGSHLEHKRQPIEVARCESNLNLILCCICQSHTVFFQLLMSLNKQTNEISDEITKSSE